MKELDGILLLFDIEGTLLNGKGDQCHLFAMGTAVEKIAGRQLPANCVWKIKPWGKTDSQIALDLWQAYCDDLKLPDDYLQKWTETTVEIYQSMPSLQINTFQAMPYALNQLRSIGATLSLLTGNIEQIARDKIRRLGLREFFPLENGGAFGDQAIIRSELVELARASCPKNNRPWTLENTILIGDTPRDIEAAHAAGIQAIAMATGIYNPEELKSANAVVENALSLPKAIRSLGQNELVG
jgi:phosphoglycolate phosphatase-like HAD superfamily hydrolase